MICFLWNCAIRNDLERPLKVIYVPYTVLLSIHTAHILYEVNYNGRTSYANFYCRIPPEALSYDAERDCLR